MKDALGHGSNARGARQELTALRKAADKRYAKRMEPPGTTPAQRALIASLGTAQDEPKIPVGASGVFAKAQLLAARLKSDSHSVGVHLATHRRKLPS